MPPQHRAEPVRPRFLRSVGVGVVLLGYLGVLLGTSAGQGLTLLAHVSMESHTAWQAPRLQSPATEVPALGSSTLRAPAHTHGGHTHHHGSALPGAWRTVRTLAAPVGESEPDALPEGFHAHGGEIHSHDLPAPDPAPVVVLTLDHHQVPPPATVPAALAVPVAEAQSVPPRVLGSVSLSVETPPPIAAG